MNAHAFKHSESNVGGGERPNPAEQREIQLVSWRLGIKEGFSHGSEGSEEAPEQLPFQPTRDVYVTPRGARVDTQMPRGSGGM